LFCCVSAQFWLMAVGVSCAGLRAIHRGGGSRYDNFASKGHAPETCGRVVILKALF
jgi:hypothetical protein